MTPLSLTRRAASACLLFLCTSSSSWALTTLTFHVDATVSTLDSQLNWQPSGSSQFTLSVTVDESRYSAVLYDPADLAGTTYSGISTMDIPISRIAGTSADAARRIASHPDIAGNPSPRYAAEYFEISEFGRSQSATLGGQSDHSYATGSPYVASYWFGDFEVQRTYQYIESLQLGISEYMSRDPALPTPDDFFGLMNGALNVNDAFYFWHQIQGYAEECRVNIANPSCMSSDNGMPAMDVDGVYYSGNATLVGISTVPIPAAGWCFATALLALLGLRARR